MESRLLGGLVTRLVITDKSYDKGFLKNTVHLLALLIIRCAHSHPAMLEQQRNGMITITLPEELPLQGSWKFGFQKLTCMKTCWF